MKVYLIMRESGSWDSYDDSPVCIFSTLESATKFIDRKNSQLRRLKDYSRKFMEKYEEYEDDYELNKNYLEYLDQQYHKYADILEINGFRFIEFEVL